MADLESAAFEMVRAKTLEGVPHGFFGSAGGAHQFGFGGPGDEAAIRALRHAAADATLPGAALIAPHQVHSPDVVSVSGEVWPDEATGRPVADALVTSRKDVVLAIVTADCGPVLFADCEAGVVGAAHAGWRGAYGGVLENTLAAMEALGARRARITAALGPTIAQPSYEVDAAFRDHFAPTDAHCFQTAPEREGIARWHFDLPAYILARLNAAGVGQAVSLGLDTFSLSEQYHSYRRASQCGLPDYGRNLSAIGVG